jgi:hypothetical protein
MFDGRDRNGQGFDPAFITRRSFWYYYWQRFLSLPLVQVLPLEASDFAGDKVHQQRIFGTHPHGALCFHHTAFMVPEVCTKREESFEAISPMANRRELAASLAFRIPLLREIIIKIG